MSSKTFLLESGSTAAAASTSPLAIATTTATTQVLLQMAPTQGVEIIQWGISFNGSAAATPGFAELVEVDVAASGGTASIIPCSYVTTAISASTTTSLIVNAALQPSSPTAAVYQIGTMALGGAAGNGENMLVTSGGTGTTLTVTRGINGTTALTSIPVGTFVYALPGSGVVSDIQPQSSLPFADPTYCSIANAGTALTGWGFSTLNVPKRMRHGDVQQLTPTSPYVLQFPLERGFEVNPGKFVQVRITGWTGVSAYASLLFAA